MTTHNLSLLVVVVVVVMLLRIWHRIFDICLNLFHFDDFVLSLQYFDEPVDMIS